MVGGSFECLADSKTIIRGWWVVGSPGQTQETYCELSRDMPLFPEQMWDRPTYTCEASSEK